MNRQPEDHEEAVLAEVEFQVRDEVLCSER